MLKTIHNCAHTQEDINVETQVHAPLSSGIKVILPFELFTEWGDGTFE